MSARLAWQVSFNVTSLPIQEGNIHSKSARTSEFENGKREPHLFVLMAYARLGKVHLQSVVDDDITVTTFRTRIGHEVDYAKLLRRRKL
jgi:hypothetical protein